MAQSNVVFVLEIILAFFLPPVVVFIETGCSCTLLLNIVLTLLLWIPGKLLRMLMPDSKGFIHALMVIFEKRHQARAMQPAQVIVV